MMCTFYGTCNRVDPLPIMASAGAGSDSGDELEQPRAKKPRLELPSSPTTLSSPPQHSLSTLPTITSVALVYNMAPLRRFCQPKVGLNVDYYPRFFGKAVSDSLLKQLETQLLPYYETSKNEVKIYGKVFKIPRKQTAFGDAGLTYNFSGTTVAANEWIPLITDIKSSVESALEESFNFVLVNRYGNGNDHIGEHRDDESDLIKGAPIASVTLGCARDFVFKHKDARGKKATRKDICPVTLCLEHGSLLVMKHPTNTEWYHSLPVRKRVHGVRVNLTFRRMKGKS